MPVGGGETEAKGGEALCSWEIGLIWIVLLSNSSGLLSSSGGFFVVFWAFGDRYGAAELIFSMRTNPKRNMVTRRSGPADVRIPEHGLWVLESHHAEAFHMEMGRWPFHKLCWVAIGRGLLEMEQGSLPIQRNQFLLLPAGLEHRFVDHGAEPMTLVITCMDERFLKPRGWREQAWKEAFESHPAGRPRKARSAFQHSEMIDRLKLMLREQRSRQTGWELASISAAGDLIVHLLRSCVSADEFESDSARAVEGIVEYLDTNFYKQVQLPELAGRCEMSKRRFTELFKNRTGKTVTQYLNDRRIEYAKERLRETEHILYSCYESGFRDVAYFYRVFKRQAGMTPGDFLKSVKEDARN